VASFALWNVDVAASLNLGSIAARTESFIPLFSNPHTAECTGVIFIICRRKRVRFMEFMTRCSQEMQIDTNTSSEVPVLFSSPQHHVFRCPQIEDVFALYRVHRMLVNEITHGALPVLLAAGQAVAELKRRLDRCGRGRKPFWERGAPFGPCRWSAAGGCRRKIRPSSIEEASLPRTLLNPVTRLAARF